MCKMYNTLDKSWKTAQMIGVVCRMDVAMFKGITCDGKALVHRNWQFPIANVPIDRNSAFSTCTGRPMLNVSISNNLGLLCLFICRQNMDGNFPLPYIRAIFPFNCINFVVIPHYYGRFRTILLKQLTFENPF